MPFKIVFIFPSLSRPAKFFATLDNLKEMCISDNYQVICVLENSDASMNNDEVKERISQYPNVKPCYTDSTGKIDAINQGLNYLPDDYDIMILIADDIVFTMRGFDSLIESDMQQFFPDLDGLLHYPDNIPQSGERQITMPVMGKNLLNKWGYIYHPSYLSTWCDNEQIAVSKAIGKHKFIRFHFYDHNHPAWGKGENDDLYRKNEALYQTDSINYFKRLSLNFDL